MENQFDEMKGNSTCKQKEYARQHNGRNLRWNLKGNRTNVKYIAFISMVWSFASLTFYIYDVVILMSTPTAVIFQILTIILFLIQFISAIILLTGIHKERNYIYVHLSSRIWAGVSRFLIIFHTLNISLHFFLWTINPIRTSHTFHTLYISLISAVTVIFLAIGVHYVKWFIIEIDHVNNDTTQHNSIDLNEIHNSK